MSGTLLAAAVLGLIIGAVLGGLGGGGSILTVPALIYLLGQDPHTATTASLIVVGITALIGAATHARQGRVHWRHGVLFGVLGVAGTVVGTRVAAGIDAHVLMLAFAVLMLVAAVAMTRSRPQVCGSSDTAGDRLPARWRGTRMARIVAAATGVGVLTGFFGVGGGFVVVPALVLALGMAMPEAVGTSLVVITVNSATALAARLGTPLDVSWAIVAPFAIFAVLGAVISTRLTDVLPTRVLTAAFASLLVLVALGVGAASVVSLA
jgi:uncharacterized membrane protein YfcA